MTPGVCRASSSVSETTHVVQLLEVRTVTVRREDLVRHLRHRFNALLGVCLVCWMTMSGLLLFIGLHGQVMHIRPHLWWAIGATVSVLQLIALVIIALRLRTTMKVRSKLLVNLEYESGHDPLTGLFNRRAFELYLEEVMDVASRQKQAFSLLYLDLDGFKQINDRHGHASGDALLKTVAANWSRAVREGDVLARLGGDEFVMLSHSTQEEVEVVCRRLLDIGGQALPDGISSHGLGVSIGIAEFPRDGQDAAGLILAADTAMLAAKALGKSRFQWAVPAPRPAVKLAQPLGDPARG